MKKKNYKIHYNQNGKNKEYLLTFEGHLGRENIRSIKEELLSLGLKSGNTIIQIKHVETFDMASVQFILILKKTLEKKNKKSEVRIEATLNENNKTLVRNLGFNEIINI